MCDANEHVHIVLTAKQATQTLLKKTAKIAEQLVGKNNVHLVASGEPTSGIISEPKNTIIEPSIRGGSAAVGFAGCHLYRIDPTAVMILVDVDEPTSGARLQTNFDKLAASASVSGSLVSLGASHEADAGIYAWSIYALMESYRHYSPIDFQVLNEIAKVWGRDAGRVKELYGKLSNEPINVRLLSKASPGYPTHNVIVAEPVRGTTAQSAPIRGGDVSDGAIISTPEESL